IPWNLVNCWSDAEMAPVLASCNPSAMVPLRKLELILMSSFVIGGGSSPFSTDTPRASQTFGSQAL
ncbi:hypothetical protein WICPIJ_000407, partial [Wickerhamomyces pijperi]